MAKITILAPERTKSANKPRGRPKLDFTPFMDECYRRMKAHEARETVQAEARDLAKWGEKEKLQVPGGGPLKLEQIRNRLNKRFNGAAGYKSAREHFLQSPPVQTV